MKWCQYIKKYDECLEDMEEKKALRILKSAIKNHVCFSGKEIADISEELYLDDKMILALFESSDKTSYQAKDLERIIISLRDEKNLRKVINEICKFPLHFKENELLSLCEVLFEEEYIGKILLANQSKLSKDIFDDICLFFTDEHILKKVAQKNKIPYVYNQPRKENRIGFIRLIMIMIGFFSSDDQNDL